MLAKSLGQNKQSKQSVESQIRKKTNSVKKGSKKSSKSNINSKNKRFNNTIVNDKTKPLIELIDVYKEYVMSKKSKVVALRGVNLEIYPNEFVVIIGPSGSGKSTLVNIVGCLDRPTRGVVKLKGKDVSKLTDSQLAQLRGKTIGFIFQQFNLLNSFNALENVMIPMLFHNVPLSERKKRALNLLKRLGLEDRLNHKPNELSGGQQQRVAIARALAVNPEIILADEPTGNLDSRSGDEVIKILKELHAEGKTIILVTHDVRYLNIGTRTVKLFDGKIINED